MTATLYLDAIREFMNIGLGHAAGVLNEMLRAHVDLVIPSVRLLEMDEGADLLRSNGPANSAVSMRFTGNYSGTALVVFPPASAAALVDLVLDQSNSEDDFDGLRSGTLMEIGNILINAVMGAFSAMLDEDLRFSIPIYTANLALHALRTELQGNVVLLFARADFFVRTRNVQGDVILVFDQSAIRSMLTKIEALYL